MRLTNDWSGKRVALEQQRHVKLAKQIVESTAEYVARVSVEDDVGGAGEVQHGMIWK